MTTTDSESTPSNGGGGSSAPGQEGQLAIEVEHQVKKLMNDAKEEGVPIVGHVLEGMDNIGDGGGAASDPFTQLFSSGFGWLIDSVGFIKDPIDKLDGDAAAVQTAVDSMQEITENLTYVAQGHQEDIPTLQDWAGAAGEAYLSSMRLLRAEIVSLAHVVEGLGTLAAVSGSMVMTLRKIVRDLVAVALGTIVIIMLAAMAAAIWTFGTSVAVGIASSVAVAIGVTIESTQRITKLQDALGRQTERMGELEGIAKDVADGLKRFEKSTKPHKSASGSSGGSSGGMHAPPLDYAQQPGAYPTDYTQQPAAYPADYAQQPAAYPADYYTQQPAAYYTEQPADYYTQEPAAYPADYYPQEPSYPTGPGAEIRYR